MKLSNFVLTRTKGKTPLDLEYFAEVDVETGALFWKKTTRREIRREFAGQWHFTDSGEFTTGYQANVLARAWKAKTGQDA
ncbi:MAG: hypothetical protein M0Z73_08540 [Betaproteobacteria bacterium]|nr:hypothetical protein [Betaproteobacteria bacterium]